MAAQGKWAAAYVFGHAFYCPATKLKFWNREKISDLSLPSGGIFAKLAFMNDFRELILVGDAASKRHRCR